MTEKHVHHNKKDDYSGKYQAETKTIPSFAFNWPLKVVTPLTEE